MSIKWEKDDILLTLKNSMMTIKKTLDYGLFQLHLKMSPWQEYSPLLFDETSDPKGLLALAITLIGKSEQMNR